MQTHRRDALVSGLIGLICGAVVGSGFMGFLHPLTSELTSPAHAADWFSGAGTWVVGFAATALTIQQHRAVAARDKLTKQQLDNETKAAEQRLRAERQERENRRHREALGDWNHYRTHLTRLISTYPMIAGSLEMGDQIPADEATGLARGVQAAIPREELSHSKFFVDETQMSCIAGLEVGVALLRTCCESFLGLPDTSGRRIFNLLSGDEVRAYRELSDAAQVVSTDAAQVVSTQAVKVFEMVERMRPDQPTTD
ncbi:hypothetical protein PDM28_16720 [Stenotrophomonas aracearum]|jgi:hypothetical protein|uniref:Uncharacterized protein n=1 Tax=Stenotrophomonas aracearum TaxID=3003272 RepID=A0ABY9YD08_9GAMM|nr:hypothetical protein [Stenotrophomonas sp. A5588]WNH48293.1 hypothetical protein PDM28_16720 [Stenotrophomonas sp. A5588]